MKCLFKSEHYFDSVPIETPFTEYGERTATKTQEASLGSRTQPRLQSRSEESVFKSAATIASVKPGPFQEFYAALLAKGMRPEVARLALARKIATIVLIVWKKGVFL
jgi:hypothetical protein